MFIKLFENNIIPIIAFVNYTFINYKIDDYVYAFLSYMFLLNVSIYSFLHAIKLIVKKNNKITKQNYNIENYINILIFSFINSISFIIFYNYFIVSNNRYNVIYHLLKFYPLFFAYEIIFDFFFYIIHYTLHSNNTLYKIIHKKHHRITEMDAILNFYMSPIEMIICVEIPSFITLYIIKLFCNITLYEYILITYYRIIVEIYGHSGHKQIDLLNNTYSYFYMYNLVFRYFKININPIDHELHHKILVKNYGKRTILFDKLFKTYKSTNNITL